MTVKEVSEYLRIHPITVYRLLRERRLPAFRVGSEWRFNIDAIDHWSREQMKRQ
jgi:excisionase family DNA binding protein